MYLYRISKHVSRSERFAESRDIYETMWKNMVEPDRPDDDVIQHTNFEICISDN
jgi:hypothetical protein